MASKWPAPLRVVFAGTPEFAVPSLDACRIDGVTLAAVFTQPDRGAGRGRELRASPVKQRALALGVPVEHPATLRAPAAQEGLAADRPELVVVVAYGLILPQAVLAMPRLGCWNVHASLLPRWRGAAPIQRAIAAGDTESGVCLMRMEAGLDTGPILLRRRTPIHADDTGGSLHDRLSALGAQALGDGLARLLAGDPPTPTPQGAASATYARKLTKAEADLDLAKTATELARQVRAFDPWPVATVTLDGEKVRVWKAEALPDAAAAAPGTVVAAGPDGIDIACGSGVLRLLELQRPGKRRIPVAAYLNARPRLA